MVFSPHVRAVSRRCCRSCRRGERRRRPRPAAAACSSRSPASGSSSGGMSIAQVESPAGVLHRQLDLGAVQVHVRQHAPDRPRSDRHRERGGDGVGRARRDHEAVVRDRQDQRALRDRRRRVVQVDRRAVGERRAGEQVVVHLHDDPRPGLEADARPRRKRRRPRARHPPADRRRRIGARPDSAAGEAGPAEARLGRVLALGLARPRPAARRTPTRDARWPASRVDVEADQVLRG